MVKTAPLISQCHYLSAEGGIPQHQTHFSAT